jgi:4-amino-4-deoxy-L-arabinose transferase-like glycosyltransferase
VAHAAYIHTDAGAALTMTATVVAALLAARARKLLPWLITGVCLGLALATKFTGILLVPVVLGFPFLEALTAPEKRPRKAVFENVLYAVLAVTVGVLLLALTYTVCLRDMPQERAETSIREFLARRGASPALLETNAALCRFSPPLGHYAGGLLGVQLLSSNGRGAANYLHGQVSERGFPHYFPVAMAVKWTPALLLCLALALVLSGRRLLSYETLALSLPALFHLAVAIPSSFNIGVRHVLPMVPLLALAGSGLLVKRLAARPFLLLTAFLSVSAAFSLWRVHPYEIAYFNVFAGGRENGAAWLGLEPRLGQDPPASTRS